MADSCLTAPRPDGANSADATALGPSVATVYRIELMIRFDHPRTAHLKHENRALPDRARARSEGETESPPGCPGQDVEAHDLHDPSAAHVAQASKFGEVSDASRRRRMMS